MAAFPSRLCTAKLSVCTESFFLARTARLLHSIYYLIKETIRRHQSKKKRCTHTRNVVIGAHALGEQSVSNFPGKDGRAFSLVVGDLGNHRCGGHSGFRAPYRSRFDGTGLVIPAATKHTQMICVHVYI